MPQKEDFAKWEQQVQGLFPELKDHQKKSLALYSYGVILAGCCGLSSVVLHLRLLLGLAVGTLKDRLRDFYREGKAQKGSARSEVDPTICFAPILRWAAGTTPHKRIAIALDPTALSNRFRVLCVTVLFEGFGIPVAWKVQRADEKGSWNDIWKDLLGTLKEALGEGYEVLVLTDRGLESKGLFEAIRALGWHPWMRVKTKATFRPCGWHKAYSFKEFAHKVGRPVSPANDRSRRRGRAWGGFSQHGWVRMHAVGLLGRRP